MSSTATLPNTTAAPLGRVVFEVTLNGQVVNLSVASIAIQHQANKLPSATITFTYGGQVKPANGTTNAADNTAVKPAPGHEVTIKAGYQRAQHTLFKGLVARAAFSDNNYDTPHLRGTTLVAHCRHPLFNATLSKQNNLYLNSTDDAVITELLKKYGQTATVESTQHEHPELVQYQTTDWAFLIERATLHGFVVAVNPEQITVGLPDAQQPPTAVLNYGTNMIDIDAELDGGTAIGAVHVHARDPLKQAEDEATDNISTGNGPAGNSPAAEQEVHIYHTGYVPDPLKKAMANGQKIRRHLASKRGRVKVLGGTTVNVGGTVELKGTEAAFAGTAYVSGVAHTISQGQWYTDLQFGLSLPDADNYRTPNGQGQQHDFGGLFIGKVVEIADDPDGNERILVNVPVLHPTEGLWARLAMPDAGADRGLVCWPEPDDEVVVGFLQNDPSQPVVVGRLYSETNAAPFPATADNYQKGYKSKSGLVLLFDDEAPAITLQTPNGNMATLTDQDAGIVLTDENSNEVLLSADGITLTSSKDLIISAKGEVNITGQTINLAADIEANIEAKTGVTLASNAMNTIKGNPVKIN